MKKRKTKKTVCQKAKKLFCFIFLSILIVSIIPAIYAFLFPNESNRLTAFQLWVFLVVLISTFFISRNIFDFYMIDYRFWKKVLAPPKAFTTIYERQLGVLVFLSLGIAKGIMLFSPTLP